MRLEDFVVKGIETTMRLEDFVVLSYDCGHYQALNKKDARVKRISVDAGSPVIDGVMVIANSRCGYCFAVDEFKPKKVVVVS